MKGLKGQDLISKLRSIFPPLKSKSQKGESGRLAVIGGSYQFTGAPYYSAMSSLKVGTDLAHVFCSKASSSAIKSYSPQLIVHPIFISSQQHKCLESQLKPMLDDWLQKIKTWQKAILTWVIGPGLGRDKYMHDFFPLLVRNLPANSTVVFDADGIYYLCQHVELFKQLSKFKTIITPNRKQLILIQNALKINVQQYLDKLPAKTQAMVQEFQTDLKFNDFTLFVKGERDVIFGKRNFVVNAEGGPKRCAGIGDILAGTVAACCYWDFQYGPALASLIVRMSTKRAFQKEGRGLTAPNIVSELTQTVKILDSKMPLL